MKPAAFDYLRAHSVDDALAALARAEGDALLLAGGQSLGPMLNLRLVQPALLVDIRRIAELAEVRDAQHAVLIGAAITHAALEDGRVAGAVGALLRHVAAGIAYRAIRNRGTIGGSVCHADPAGDWPTALTLLDATARLVGPSGPREVPLAQFILGPYGTQIEPGEMLTAIAVPRLSAQARWAYCKFCRKPGEFAESIAGILVDPERGVQRAVLGATAAAPIVIEDPGFLLDGFDAAAAAGWLAGAGFGEEGAQADADEETAYARRMHLAVLQRAARQFSLHDAARVA